MFDACSSVKREGGNSADVSCDGGNSNFLSCSEESCFCSDFFPAAMALQIQQGRLPSKVRETASTSGARLKLSASIVVHAIDCRKAQCAPVITTSVATIKSLAKRANMTVRILRV